MRNRFFILLIVLWYVASSFFSGQTFNEIRIGNQVWMRDNLSVDRFRNGDIIPEARTEGEWKAYAQAGEAAWCYFGNDESNGAKYGRMYNWYAVNDQRGISPWGWHVASQNEWNTLEAFLGGDGVAGAKMKSKDGWWEGGCGTNSSGFSGLPGGLRMINGWFSYLNMSSFWWTSTEANSKEAYFRNLNFENGNLSWNPGNKQDGMYIRCIRD